jgi:hypothetical protein
MIVRHAPNGQLICIQQTSHALMAAELCRHWGNRDFAPPSPYAPVLSAIAQHDNGWYEWECAPEVRADGVPMDFMHGPTGETKRRLWERGIARVLAQHPYAGLLVSRHAVLLYQSNLAQLAPDERRSAEACIAGQAPLIDQVRHAVENDPTLRHACTAAPLAAQTRLLQIGDAATLQVTVPWGRTQRFAETPVDMAGTQTTLTLTWEDDLLSFDPWPFGVDNFALHIHGRILDQPTFATHAAYRAALAQAPQHHIRLRVVRP